MRDLPSGIEKPIVRAKTYSYTLPGLSLRTLTAQKAVFMN